MNCKCCGLPLSIVKGGNKTEEGTTNWVLVQLHACTNVNCAMYTGSDLSNTQNIQQRIESAPQPSVIF